MGEERQLSSAQVNARLSNISHNVRCTECGNQSIEDSQADIAILLKKLIRDEIQSGKSDKDIYDKLREDYGESILYAPVFNMQNAFFYVFPYVFAIGYFGGMAINKQRKKSDTVQMAKKLIEEVPFTDKERESMFKLLQPPKRSWWRWSS